MSGSGIDRIYADKPGSYFANARHDMVALLPTGPQSAVLELGCGAGGTGRAAIARGKAGRYVGLELNREAAAIAADDFEVIVGDVAAINLDPLIGQFDALIISEVLEHLIDPWTVVRQLVGCVRPGGFVIASSPNISDWRNLRRLVQGRFDYEESGIMDRTHLRWFTPRSYRALFEDAGVTVESVGPIRRPGVGGRVAIVLSGGRLAHLFMTQMMLSGVRR